MKIACLGDSLTEGDYGVYQKRGIADVKSKNYPYFLGKLLDAEVLNYGKCGYTSSSYLEHYKEGNADVSDADVVIVMLGTNGGMDDEVCTQGNKDFDELINLIKSDAPRAKLFICTPPHATRNEEMSNCGYAEQVEKAVRFVRKYTKKNGIACIELAECELFCAENESILQPNDGLHYSEAGYAIMAIAVKDALKAQM